MKLISRVTTLIIMMDCRDLRCPSKWTAGSTSVRIKLATPNTQTFRIMIIGSNHFTNDILITGCAVQTVLYALLQEGANSMHPDSQSIKVNVQFCC
jgi:hypothetical protein